MAFLSNFSVTKNKQKETPGLLKYSDAIFDGNGMKLKEEENSCLSWNFCHTEYSGTTSWFQWVLIAVTVFSLDHNLGNKCNQHNTSSHGYGE